MNWYIAKIVFRIVSGDGKHQPQFDEQLRLIEADNEKTAFQKARNIGQQEQDSFPNAFSQVVKWEFIDVAELNQLGELTDGAELYYHIQETDHADVYIAWTRHRASLLAIN
jgi:hypothetical protein